MNSTLLSAEMNVSQRIEQLQIIQRRSQQLTDGLEQRAHLTREELHRLDAEHAQWRARQMLLWHLQGETALVRAFDAWPTSLIEAHGHTATT